MGTENDARYAVLENAILVLCRESYASSPSLEIDGIICISSHKSDQNHVVKIHRKINGDISTKLEETVKLLKSLLSCRAKKKQNDDFESCELLNSLPSQESLFQNSHSIDQQLELRHSLNKTFAIDDIAMTDYREKAKDFNEKQTDRHNQVGSLMTKCPDNETNKNISPKICKPNIGLPINVNEDKIGNNAQDFGDLLNSSDEKTLTCNNISGGADGGGVRIDCVGSGRMDHSDSGNSFVQMEASVEIATKCTDTENTKNVISDIIEESNANDTSEICTPKYMYMYRQGSSVACIADNEACVNINAKVICTESPCDLSEQISDMETEAGLSDNHIGEEHTESYVLFGKKGVTRNKRGSFEFSIENLQQDRSTEENDGAVEKNTLLSISNLLNDHEQNVIGKSSCNEDNKYDQACCSSDMLDNSLKKTELESNHFLPEQNLALIKQEVIDIEYDKCSNTYLTLNDKSYDMKDYDQKLLTNTVRTPRMRCGSRRWHQKLSYEYDNIKSSVKKNKKTGHSKYPQDHTDCPEVASKCKSEMQNLLYPFSTSDHVNKPGYFQIKTNNSFENCTKVNRYSSNNSSLDPGNTGDMVDDYKEESSSNEPPYNPDYNLVESNNIQGCIDYTTTETENAEDTNSDIPVTNQSLKFLDVGNSGHIPLYLKEQARDIYINMQFEKDGIKNPWKCNQNDDMVIASNIKKREKKFFCQYCGAGFTMNCAKTRHEKTTCSGILCACDICDSKFSRSDSKARHMWSCHGIKSRKHTFF